MAHIWQPRKAEQCKLSNVFKYYRVVLSTPNVFLMASMKFQVARWHVCGKEFYSNYSNKKVFFLLLRISLEIETNLLFISQPTVNTLQWITIRGVEENMAERQSLMLAG